MYSLEFSFFRCKIFKGTINTGNMIFFNSRPKNILSSLEFTVCLRENR